MTLLLNLLLAALASLLPACDPEGATTCYWDATAHGNGAGTSFVDLSGATFYLEG